MNARGWYFLPPVAGPVTPAADRAARKAATLNRHIADAATAAPARFDAALVLYAVDRHRQVVGELVALLEMRAELADALTPADRARILSYAHRVEATASATARTLRALLAGGDECDAS